MSLEPADTGVRDPLERIARLLRQQAGLTFEQGRRRVLQTRLEEVADSLRTGGLEGLYRRLLADSPADDSWRRVIDATVTDETSWFRYPHLFEALKEYVLPAVASNRSYDSRGTIRILSAGCSRGHEPYSLALMIDADEERRPGTTFQIEAIDISEASLRHARSALYSEPEMRGLPPRFRERYFTPEPAGWRLHESLRQRVSFRSHNLLCPILSGPYDVILCCNVLIYFEREDSRRALAHLAAALGAGAHLFVGHAESYHGVMPDLYQVQLGGAVAYRRRHALSSVERRA